ncbi:hypothetical protein [Nocardioides zeae]|uniref:Uncharacterized protein n=1 Tax=Nocardioides zeae TaxID=1457234 RepID=A0A6P0HN12_9ACTN|nr:hypothetical protein [Nocardioides zeae]NEN80003.1 hypothetical protein [Nocardioides zeae]
MPSPASDLVVVRRGALVVLGIVAPVVTLLGFALLLGSGNGVVLVPGLLLCVALAGGVAQERAYVAGERHPPAPTLVVLRGGEPALFLPRDRAVVQNVTRVLLGTGVTLLIGAVLALVSAHWLLASACGLAGVAFLVVAAPGRDTAGGVWLTPHRVIAEHLGTTWEVPWTAIARVDPGEPLEIALHDGARPVVDRHGPPVRSWRVRPLTLRTRWLAGGAETAAYVVGRAAADPRFRAGLGTPGSLPPVV